MWFVGIVLFSRPQKKKKAFISWKYHNLVMSRNSFSADFYFEFLSFFCFAAAICMNAIHVFRYHIIKCLIHLHINLQSSYPERNSLLSFLFLSSTVLPFDLSWQPSARLWNASYALLHLLFLNLLETFLLMHFCIIAVVNFVLILHTLMGLNDYSL